MGSVDPEFTSSQVNKNSALGLFPFSFPCPNSARGGFIFTCHPSSSNRAKELHLLNKNVLNNLKETTTLSYFNHLHVSYYLMH